MRGELYSVVKHARILSTFSSSGWLSESWVFQFLKNWSGALLCNSFVVIFSFSRTGKICSHYSGCDVAH